MKYRIIKAEFGDGAVRYMVQYKRFDWIPFWLDYTYRDHSLYDNKRHKWFRTQKDAEVHFRSHYRPCFSKYKIVEITDGEL